MTDRTCDCCDEEATIMLFVVLHNGEEAALCSRCYRTQQHQDEEP